MTGPRGFDVDYQIREELREETARRAELYSRPVDPQELPELPKGADLSSEPRVPLERLSAADRAAYRDGTWLRLSSEELIRRAGLDRARRDPGELAAAELAARVRVALGGGSA